MTRLGGSPDRVAALFAGYALMHSALAARQTKAATQRIAGERYRNGLYRFLFNAQAVVLFAWSAWAFLRLPDRTLYRVPAPWSILLVALQVAGLGLMASAAWAVGLPRITGLGPLAELLAGGRPAPEPEAQGPPPGPDGELLMRGPFRVTRHPANWGPLPMVLCFPHMTVNRATLAALSVAYLVLGSIHEERRLEAAYGDAYLRYRRRAPFLAGVPRGRTRPTSIGRMMPDPESARVSFDRSTAALRPEQDEERSRGMSTTIAQPTYLESARAGTFAGIIGSVVQVAVGLVLDKLLLPSRQHNNIAPRLIKRLFQKGGQPTRPVRDWTLGTLFHVGYGIGWGCALGLARRWSKIPSPLLGGLTGLLLYLLAFSGVGAGTRTGTERQPRHRDWRKQLSLIAVASTFAMSTAASYDRLVRRS